MVDIAYVKKLKQIDKQISGTVFYFYLTIGQVAVISVLSMLESNGTCLNPGSYFLMIAAVVLWFNIIRLVEARNRFVLSVRRLEEILGNLR